MAETWTISEAARLCGCDRRTLQRAIQSGRLHLDAQYRLSREALLAAGYLSADTPQDAPQDAPQTARDLSPILETLERLIRAVEGIRHAVDTLRMEMRQPPQGPPQTAPQETPQGAPQRDERPQTTPQRRPQGAPQIMPRPTPQQRAGRPRSALGQRILTLLGAHPEGLSAEQIRAALSPERPIGDILSGMRRTNAVQALGEGRKLRYVLVREDDAMGG
jgi:hypothetical protein